MTIRLLLVMILPYVMFSNAYADSGPMMENDLKRAVVFGFNGIFITDFEGGIGYKTWIGPTSAVVLGLEFGYRESSEDGPDDDEYRSDVERSRDNLGVYVELQKHFARKNHLSPYTGIALKAGWTNSSWSRSYPGQTDTPNYKQTTDMFSIIPGFLLGFEYFLRDDISLSAQSSLDIAFRWGSEEINDGYYIMEIDRSEFDFHIGTSKLLLTVYF